MDKKLAAIGAAFAGLVVFWMTQGKNASTRTAMEAAEGKPAGGRAAAMSAFEGHLAQARRMLQDGQPCEAALELYHSYPGFETVLQSEGYQEVQAGLTLNAWFEGKKSEFAPVLASAYSAFLQRLGNGDAGWREMDRFLNHMPFPFVNELARKFRNEDRKEIAQARTAQASNWCYVSVIASTGDGENYERIVREALRPKWTAQPNLKLVFDSPSGEETGRAAKIIDVRIEEKFAEYAFEGKAKVRGSGKVAESALIRFSDRTRRKDAFRCNWEGLQTIAVTNEAPDKLRFKFANERQTADFSDVAGRQREALAQRLAAGLQAIPQFQVLEPARR